MRYPEIDYSVHPGYVAYQSKVRYDESHVMQLIKETDQLHEKFCALTLPSDKDAEDVLCQIQGRMKQLRYILLC
jgi:hypothetical protein